jgi:hypothetical protein
MKISSFHQSTDDSIQVAYKPSRTKYSDDASPTDKTRPTAANRFISRASKRAEYAARHATDADVDADAREALGPSFRPELAASRDSTEAPDKSLNENLHHLSLAPHIPFNEEQFKKLCIAAQRPFHFVAIRHIGALKRDVVIPVTIDEPGPLGMVIQDNTDGIVCIIKVSPTAMEACKGLLPGDILARSVHSLSPVTTGGKEECSDVKVGFLCGVDKFCADGTMNTSDIVNAADAKACRRPSMNSNTTPDNSIIDDTIGKEKVCGYNKCFDDDIVCLCKNDNEDDAGTAMSFNDDATIATSWSKQTRSTFHTEATGGAATFRTETTGGAATFRTEATECTAATFRTEATEWTTETNTSAKKGRKGGYKCWDDDIICLCNDDDDIHFDDNATAWSKLTRTFHTESNKGAATFTGEAPDSRGPHVPYDTIEFNPEEKTIPWKDYSKLKKKVKFTSGIRKSREASV